MWRSMNSGGGGGGDGRDRGIVGVAGKKRKADGGYGGERVVRREPRRGMGVAELERIRVNIEAAQNYFMIPPSPSLSTSSAAAAAMTAHLPPPPPPPSFHVAGVRYGQQQYVGNGSALQQRDHHRFTPYYGSSISPQQQHYTANDALTRFLAPSSSKAILPLQINQVDSKRVLNTSPLVLRHQQISMADNKCVLNASPLLRQQQGSSEEFYKLQLQDHRRRLQPPPPQTHGGGATETRRSQTVIPFVNLVDDSDDDQAAADAGKELDLELRL